MPSTSVVGRNGERGGEREHKMWIAAEPRTWSKLPSGAHQAAQQAAPKRRRRVRPPKPPLASSLSFRSVFHQRGRLPLSARPGR